ncbi:MAG: ComEC/Rec2 family competence protein, partial [Pseudobdellovibrionaceae bacterium]
MRGFLIFGVVLLIISPAKVPEICSNIVRNLNLDCVRTVPQNSSISEDLSALVCGITLSESKKKQNLTQVSLIHVFVVSGSHLVFVEQMISVLLWFGPQRLRFLFHGITLLLFTLATGAQAPTIRAFLAWLFRILIRNRRLGWNAVEQVGVLSFLLLCSYPLWLNSISFLLSSLAALGMAQNYFKTPAKKAVTLYLLMCPPLYFLATPHPISILCNLFLLPVVGVILFPLALFTVFFSWLLPVSEFFFEKFHSCLDYISDHLPSSATTTQSPPWLWV